MHRLYFGALSACCVASLLAGCSAPLHGVTGNGALPDLALPPVVATETTLSHRKVKVTLRIRVPRKRAHFISSSTKGIAFALTGQAKRSFVFGLTVASNPECTAKSDDTTCALSLQLDAGTYAMDVTTYDKTPAGDGFRSGANVVAQAKNIPPLFTKYNWTNAEQTIVVPANVTHMAITAAGGEGGFVFDGITNGGYGGAVTATVPVTPAETLALYVASVGGEGWQIVDHSDQSPVPGYNGGGSAGTSATTVGGGGGGTSWVENTATNVTYSDGSHQNNGVIVLQF